ncbi:MAG: hypothetical protein OEY22_00035 [Candidatus Bathyarchaeota archaeon]|nr:hypothetical protein [Candidatus Bathyarchaeota archaeon]MDH5786782.1 hypothetical protein [Candidatus Bathyarchaeota archaeon]
MPSITLSYLYTFIALLAVSTILVFSFMAYANTLRFFSETEQLKNLMDRVAMKSTQLLTLTLSTNATAEVSLQMPATIGNKQYWLKLSNDSAKAWLEGGLGNMPIEETELRVYLPKEASATGHYVGGYGTACLRCYISSGVPRIQLASLTDGD